MWREVKHVCELGQKMLWNVGNKFHFESWPEHGLYFWIPFCTCHWTKNSPTLLLIKMLNVQLIIFIKRFRIIVPRLNDDNISYHTIKSHIIIHAYVIAFLLKHILYIVQEETKNMANYASAILFLCVVAKNALSWYYSKICGTWYTYYACLYYSATIATLGCMI